MRYDKLLDFVTITTQCNPQNNHGAELKANVPLHNGETRPTGN